MTEKLLAFLRKIGLIQTEPIYYIGGSDVLPAPLKGQEEQEALDGLEQGDEVCKQRLIEHNLRLVSHLIRKYYSTYENPDEVLSIGSYGLIKAVDSFKSNYGTRFATYGAKCIQNAILS
jgi:RNA polymerase sporulation-specific sigma factor